VEDKKPNWHNQITVIDREEITIDGVTNLGSYDDQEIILETDQGMLILKGDDLNVKHLNLEKGNIIIEGFLKSLEYDDTRGQKKGKGFFERLLK
jgi:sporulation protein YabP